MAKKKKWSFSFHKDEERVMVGRIFIGYVFPCMGSPKRGEWETWNRFSDHGSAGYRTKEGAIVDMKQEHRYWLEETKKDLRELCKTLKPFLTDVEKRRLLY